jgi:hypothetical protein
MDAKAVNSQTQNSMAANSWMFTVFWEWLIFHPEDFLELCLSDGDVTSATKGEI